ncbi:hypothetical protein [Brevundimonas sp.]|uniref:hypothetical protein n=1 Tax=Brevundimonas sp. TaxID=1871086 RepID=UPI002D2A350F|nr:hypothetical protein [Brevundimonas sp.]HYD27820.1 hypothetical protein [Brevundimonas sp.]
MQRMRTGVGFYALVFVAGFLTFALHEGGHWLAAVTLGHEGYFSLNQAGARDAVGATDMLIITAAGPTLTIAQGLVALALVQARRSAAAWVFLFWAAFMRFMATVISFWNPNDEARISQHFGLGTWALPVAVTLGLSVLLVVGSRRLGLGWKTLALSWVVASAAITAVVFSGL